MYKIREHIIAKSLTLFMAIWILVLASEISINVHFCQNMVKSFSFLNEAPNCHKLAAKSTCHSIKKGCKKACSVSSANDQQTNKPCCTNKDIQFELDTDLPNFEIVSLDFSTDWAILSVPITYNFNIQKPVEKTAFQHYRPPPLYNNYIKLYQQFLC